jgi:hypothetical protein
MRAMFATISRCVRDTGVRPHFGRLTARHAPNCGIRTIPIAETGAWRSPKPEHGDHRNRAWRSPKPGIPITETGDGDRLTSVVRPLFDLR